MVKYADIDRKCENCNIYFWSPDLDRTLCGNKDCNESYADINKAEPTENISYPELFNLFRTYFLKEKAFCESAISLNRSSTNTKISSTNMNFISAGISTYETLLDSSNPRLEFFANKLLISTPFVFRFNDLENVGQTKRHNTGFFMFSLHCFESKEKKFAQNWKDEFLKIFLNFYLWLKVPLKNIYLHKDFWTDGVNSGHSVEIFINGQELGNMVFISHKNNKEREFKLLDVGLGGERIYSLMTGKKPYFEDIVLDHLRALIIATKDHLYPCKTGPGYCIRKLLQTIYGLGHKDLSSLQPQIQFIVEELKGALSEDFSDATEDLKLIAKKEHVRYDKYINKH